jgi:glycerol-3-phosphate cytidylyltransferase
MIIYTSGSFDLLHIGHLNILEKAKALGDYLIVAVSSSKLLKEKGKIEIIPFEERIRMVSSLKCVDKVVTENKIFDIDQFKNEKADYFVIGDDWEKRTDIDRLNWLRHNEKIIFLPYTKSISSTIIKKRVCKLLGDKHAS